ncbi:hypothetical protein JQ574_28940 [Bradyrhizobium sp. AUGA SZCCT0158]|uniref:hypothetical protein n=1 Tax=Bradyrhizobium sp. AUGA SZCCT0158 TaxID=2807661 RepID=UPI001BAB1291|nr:hypothetical protein [Bradyrhizobium sp. AUGA SZCCT0158]MBR1200024.1 hypothetical protein [Bradyrhizobium sp. AUGA SZCCT0158]
MKSAAAGFVGLFGHTLKRGAINWQFEVVRRDERDRYAVQLFSWVDGSPTHCRLMTFEELKAARLYDNADDWNAAALEYWRRADAQDRARRDDREELFEMFG